MGGPRLDARVHAHRTIHQVTEDLGSLRYNTAIAALMAYLNTLQERAALHDEEVAGLLLMLAPFAPHIAEELWAQLPGKPFSIHQQAFPVASPALRGGDGPGRRPDQRPHARAGPPRTPGHRSGRTPGRRASRSCRTGSSTRNPGANGVGMLRSDPESGHRPVRLRSV